MERYGGLKLINLEVEFMTRRWRIVRFLRVVGDVWVNTGKKDLIEFVDWAHEHTGIPRSSVYFQLFPAHEGIFPGYATTYAVVGQEIRAHGAEDQRSEEQGEILDLSLQHRLPAAEHLHEDAAGLRG